MRVQRGDRTAPWNINGKTWEDVIASNYKVRRVPIPELGDTEIWEIENKSGGWFHPDPHPPDRLQDPEPQRQAAVRLRAGPEGRGVRR